MIRRYARGAQAVISRAVGLRIRLHTHLRVIVSRSQRVTLEKYLNIQSWIPVCIPRVHEHGRRSVNAWTPSVRAWAWEVPRVQRLQQSHEERRTTMVGTAKGKAKLSCRRDWIFF